MGLPESRAHRRRCDIDFEAFKRVDGQEYLAAFGFAANSGMGHAVYEAELGRETFVVPALALMRGLLKPTNPMLAAAFRPNALERFWHLDYENGTAQLSSGTFGTPSTASSYRDNPALFTWMLSHPSALRMVGSVHEAAMDGRLDIRLPLAQARLTMTGKHAVRKSKHGLASKMFVTMVTVTDLTPKDEPVLEHAKREVVSYRASGYELRGWDPQLLRLGEALSKARRRRGMVDDSEWRHIGRALRMRDIRGVDKRATFDRLLPLLPEVRSWGSKAFPDWNHKELIAVGNWEKTGELKAALEALAVFRLDPEVIEELGLE